LRAIALSPTCNEQGGHYFLSLDSGKRLNRYSWTELPIPNEVIAQIHCLAVVAEKYDGIVFTDVSGNRYPSNSTMNTRMQQPIQKNNPQAI